MRTSGAMSQRLASLARQDLVRRTLDPTDRRGVVVSLTAKGRRLVDRIGAEHLGNEKLLLAPLSRQEQDALAGLLKKLLLAYEAEQPFPPGQSPMHRPRRRRKHPRQRPG